MEDTKIGKARPDDLQADRQTLSREPGRYGRRRNMGEVENGAERGPVLVIHRGILKPFMGGDAGLEGDNRQRRSQEEVKILKEPPNLVP